MLVYTALGALETDFDGLSARRRSDQRGTFIKEAKIFLKGKLKKIQRKYWSIISIFHISKNSFHFDMRLSKTKCQLNSKEKTIFLC